MEESHTPTTLPSYHPYQVFGPVMEENRKRAAEAAAAAGVGM